jgi:hypothetical protein
VDRGASTGDQQGYSHGELAGSLQRLIIHFSSSLSNVVTRTRERSERMSGTPTRWRSYSPVFGNSVLPRNQSASNPN